MKTYLVTASWMNGDRREQWQIQVRASQIRVAINRGLAHLTREMKPRNPRVLSVRAVEIKPNEQAEPFTRRRIK